MPVLLEPHDGCSLLRLTSPDGTNRLTQSTVAELGSLLLSLMAEPRPLVITGNEQFFSAGADLKEIAALDGPTAAGFSRKGQRIMDLLEGFPALTIAAISGYCFGGAIDLSLACDYRIAAPGAMFGHRGAALGILTGWGGTQRLPRLIGKARALQMFCAAEKIDALEALRIGLVNEVVDDPLDHAMTRAKSKGKKETTANQQR